MLNIEATYSDLTGTLAGRSFTAASFDQLADGELEATLAAMTILQRMVEAHVALAAATLAKRSVPELGQEGLAWRKGHASPEAMLQKILGSSKGAARRQVAVGRMMAEAEAARDLDEQAREHPEDDVLGRLAVEARPWHAAFGDAVAAGRLGAESAAGIRYGLGEPAQGVTPVALETALAGLLEECAELNADQARRAAFRVRDQIDAAGIAARAEAKRARQYWKQWVKPDGMVHGEYELDPENGAFVKDVYDQLTSPRRGGPRFVDPEKKAWAAAVASDLRSTERIAADGLVELLRIGAAADPGTVFGGNRPSVKILVTKDALDSGSGNGAIEGNPAPVPLADVDRHLCTDGYLPIAFDGDQCVDVGREQRFFTAKQRAALAARDGGCLWPECDRPPSWSEAHHIDEWVADNGRTDLKDGILLCKRDHLRLHNQGWKITRDGDEYWLVPPPTIDSDQKPIRLTSKAPLKPGNPIKPLDSGGHSGADSRGDSGAAGEESA